MHKLDDALGYGRAGVAIPHYCRDAIAIKLRHDLSLRVVAEVKEVFEVDSAYCREVDELRRGHFEQN